MIEYKIS